MKQIVNHAGATSDRIASPLPQSRWVRAAALYARLALATAFLSAVASRFGLWDRTFDLSHFKNFIQYTAEVNAFLPAAVIPTVAWAATIAETSCALLLLTGLWLRWVSLASAVLLFLFATAMTISQGIKSPMDYSVFSASSAAALLAAYAWRQHLQQASIHRSERPVSVIN